MAVWLSVSVLVLLAVWIGYTALYEGNLGQPAYTHVSTEGEVEFRRYAPFLIASTPMAEPGDKGLRRGFPVLAGYIFGGNTPGESLAMTAPVLQQKAKGDALAMGAPLIQPPSGARMAFVMPEGRTLEDLPTPKDSAVTLSEVSWGEVAAIRFSGAGKQARFEEAERRLRALLAKEGRQARGPALFAQYNSPSAFPLLRRNEVLIPLLEAAPHPAQPTK